MIKSAIGKFLTTKYDSDNIFFINFEDYSKFDFDGKIISSKFIKSIFQKITSESNENPFYNAFLKDIDEGKISKLHQNYKLLSQEPIQNSIIELLITIHLNSLLYMDPVMPPVGIQLVAVMLQPSVVRIAPNMGLHSHGVLLMTSLN